MKPFPLSLFQRHRRTPGLRLGTIPLFPALASLPFLSFLSFLSLPYTLRPSAVSTHMHVMGLTGMGKSKLLANMAAQLILQNRACAIIDPHTDLAEDVLRLLVEQGYYRRPDAMRRVLYVDFANPQRFVPFNVLRAPSSMPAPSYEIARNLVEATTRAWPSLAGGAAPQFENLLLAAASVLIDNGLPLTALTPLLTDAAYRERLLRRVRDPQVLDFFRSRYDKGAHLSESTLRRAFLLTYPPPLRYSLGQRENLLDFRALMDGQISLICNLGGLDVQTQRLLGCLLTVGFETAALSRADLPPAARSPYHLILDEFSQFAAQSGVALERVLALTRKYGLYLTLAHQTWSQVAATKLQGALQNTTFITFRLGQDDAAWGAARVAPFDPYRVTYWTRGSPSRPARPVYLSRAEQLGQWEYTLLRLRPREAIARVGGRTVCFHTLDVPSASLRVSREVERLKRQYAEQVLVPRARIADQQTEQQQVQAPPPKGQARQESRRDEHNVSESDGSDRPASASAQSPHSLHRIVPLAHVASAAQSAKERPVTQGSNADGEDEEEDDGDAVVELAKES